MSDNKVESHPVLNGKDKNGRTIRLNRQQHFQVMQQLMGLNGDGTLANMTRSEATAYVSKQLGYPVSEHVVFHCCNGLGFKYKSRKKPATRKEAVQAVLDRAEALEPRILALEALVTDPGNAPAAVLVAELKAEAHKEVIETRQLVTDLRKEVNRLFGLCDARLLKLEQKLGLPTHSPRPA